MKKTSLLLVKLLFEPVQKVVLGTILMYMDSIWWIPACSHFSQTIDCQCSRGWQSAQTVTDATSDFQELSQDAYIKCIRKTLFLLFMLFLLATSKKSSNTGWECPPQMLLVSLPDYHHHVKLFHAWRSPKMHPKPPACASHGDWSF